MPHPLRCLLRSQGHSRAAAPHFGPRGASQWVTLLPPPAPAPALANQSRGTPDQPELLSKKLAM